MSEKYLRSSGVPRGVVGQLTEIVTQDSIPQPLQLPFVIVSVNPILSGEGYILSPDSILSRDIGWGEQG